MARFLSLLLTSVILLTSFPAVAQPSFRCTGTLTRTEQAICASDTLSRLDREMVALYRERYAGHNANQKRRLKARQAIWRDWRNSCGGGKRCLQRRYEQRIEDFKASGGQASGALAIGPVAGPDVVVGRRVRDGRYELIYGDGRIEWLAIDGGSQGTVFPDGTEQQAFFQNIQGAPVPPLPNDLSAWGSTLEQRLLVAIDRLLPEADRAPYRELHAGQDFGNRMLSHVGVITYLVGN